MPAGHEHNGGRPPRPVHGGFPKGLLPDGGIPFLSDIMRDGDGILILALLLLLYDDGCDRLLLYALLYILL